MKKHILSRYSEKENRRVIQFRAEGNTLETRIVENSDPDEFALGPTAVTEQVETSDPDEFILQSPTMRTFQKEDSDTDEFFVDAITNCKGEDFDSLLLI